MASAAARFHARIVVDGVSLLQALAEVREQAPTRAPAVEVSAPLRLIAQVSAWRQAYHLTQVQMARLCHVSLATYRKWEGGQHQPQYQAQRRIRQLIAKPPPKAYQQAIPKLPQRILDTLRQLPEGRAHYTVLVHRLGSTPMHVRTTCYRMMLDGRLTWEKPGVYALARRSAG